MPRNKSNWGRRPPKPKRPPLTHFLCVPLVTSTSRPQLEASVERFRNEVVLDSTGASVLEPSPDLVGPSQASNTQSEETGVEPITTKTRIHPKSIRPVGTLHCTLGVMSLSENQLKEAVTLLKNLDLGFLLSGSAGQRISTQQTPSATGMSVPVTAPQLTVELKGLVSMHDPTETSILYVSPGDPSGRLYSFCQTIQTLFTEKGLMVKDDRPLKLHATVINTIYAKGRRKSGRPPQRGLAMNALQGSSTSVEDRSHGHGPDADAPLKIDARGLLDQYRDFVWAQDIKLDRIAICEMGAKRRFDDAGNVVDEEYTEVASIILPI
ncbi:hypothetical protein K431DRAFT_282296 [Polychaeton citri CBS 116435]|uniref:A-kinase anchor protein 7-like phosphoesterase domain-containing protein n=1 Tax=Polychaeton citri CBS 116435 TaxID=1314669 RepID=A0A9P4QDT0_9PEZI|nr:hypothetical protein K431DRAFT_282296 [Polychaeton citri CBS 116435]